ncbi:MAG TPA: hypothetical protein VKR80_07350 [Candidatus Limnocylindria bacterium]|nr:hypothetical protein [Candidatus Limnocylindria bacterium]
MTIAPRDVAQQTETLAQTFVDLLDRQPTGARRGELDRQRQPIQPSADAIDDGIGCDHAAAALSSAFEEERARLGMFERWQRPDRLAGNAETLTARHEQAETGGGGQEVGRGRCARVHEVLTAVHHQQSAAHPDETRGMCECLRGRRLVGAQRARDGRPDE